MTATTNNKLTLPTVHLNGTDRQSLLDGYLNALSALQALDTTLRAAYPNGRDYYPQGGDAINSAIKQHEDRLQRLADIRLELIEIAQHIADTGGSR